MDNIKVMMTVAGISGALIYGIGSLLSLSAPAMLLAGVVAGAVVAVLHVEARDDI